MWIFLFLLPFFAFAQEELDLSAIQNLEDILPDNDIPRDAYRNVEYEKKNRDFRPPVRIIPLQEILESGAKEAFIKAGTVIYRISDNKAMRVSKDMYLRVFQLEDELGFRYFENKDGSMTYKASDKYVEPITEEISLYEPPSRFFTAKTMVRSEYDKKLKLVPEGAVYAGFVQSRYMRDLFNDPKARTGSTNQYAFHLFTKWDLPFKVGGSVHYERSSYHLTGGGLIFYEAMSIGPQFRTSDFNLFETFWRITTQIRVSPFAKLRGETVNGNVAFKFNSTDVMSTFEHPFDNRWGQFVLGAFHQIQWLNMKDQPEIISVRANNQTNQSFGLFVSQVFQ